MTRPFLRLAAALGLAAMSLAGCGGGSGPGATSATSLDPSNWPSVQAAAKGQTVNWHMYGGDATLNTFVQGYLADRLKALGVTMNEVKITDTVDAVNAVLAQKQAGKTGGGVVDAIWVNGENFATGVQAKIWSCGWAEELPNARYVDFTDPAVTSDFGVPVDGCESWDPLESTCRHASLSIL